MVRVFAEWFEQERKLSDHNRLCTSMMLLSGDIYLGKAQDGLMDVNYRRVITDEATKEESGWSSGESGSTVRFKGIDGKEHVLLCKFNTREINKRTF
ncbi:hypothetical protein [Enterococcus faecalis]|uniref:hypothetical protein n=1 Tax=Enterococcus faecalis TaxID=1351 RepID=UPI003DA124BE